MNNATQHYNNVNKNDKKSPGTWLNSKDVKSIVSDLNSNPEKNEDGSWLFDDSLYAHYCYYLDPTLVSNDKTEENKTDDILDDKFDTCFDYFIEHITSKGVGFIKKYATSKEIFAQFTEKQKLVFYNFAFDFILSTSGIKSKREIQYTASIILNSKKAPPNTEFVWFENKDIIITGTGVKLK
jgi:hypothetical protein